MTKNLWRSSNICFAFASVWAVYIAFALRCFETDAGAVWDLRAELPDDRDTWVKTLKFVAEGMYQQADWLQFDSVYEEMMEDGELPWCAPPGGSDMVGRT